MSKAPRRLPVVKSQTSKPSRSRRIANRLSTPEIRDFISADSLAYLSDAGLYAFVGGKQPGYCDACFSADYPVATTGEHERRQMKLFEALELGPRRKRAAKG